MPCNQCNEPPKIRCATNRLPVGQPCSIPQYQQVPMVYTQPHCERPPEPKCDNPCDLLPIDEWLPNSTYAGFDYNPSTQSKIMYQIPMAFVNTKSLGRTGVCSDLNEGWRWIDPCTGYIHNEVNYCYTVRNEDGTILHSQDTRFPYEALSPRSRCAVGTNCSPADCPIGKVLTVVEGDNCSKVGCNDDCKFELRDPVTTKIAVTDKDTGQVVDLPIINGKVTIPVKNGLGVELNIENDGTIVPRWKAKNTNTVSHEFDVDGFVLSRVILDPDPANLTVATPNGLLSKLYKDPNDFTGDGTSTNPLNIKINPDTCNLLKSTADGLLVKPIFDTNFFSGCGATNDNPITLKNCPGFTSKFLTQADDEYFSFKAKTDGAVAGTLVGNVSVVVGDAVRQDEVASNNQGSVPSFTWQVDWSFKVPDTGCVGFDWLVQYNTQALTNYQAKLEAINYRASIKVTSNAVIKTPSDQEVGSFWIPAGAYNSSQNDFGSENTNSSADKTGLMVIKSNSTVSGNLRMRANFANGVNPALVVDNNNTPLLNNLKSLFTSVSVDFVLLKKIKAI